MKYDIESRNRLNRLYGEILSQYPDEKPKILEIFKQHQLMIPRDQLTWSDRKILAQTCINIFSLLSWAETVAENDEDIDRLNELGNNIDPMGNYWWGLYDYTYKDFIPPSVYSCIHDELIKMYDSLCSCIK